MQNSAAQALDRLLGHLYDAVLAPDGFQSFIRHLAAHFHLKGVALIVRHTQAMDASGLWLHGIEPRWMESYALTYGREDLLAHHLAEAPIGRFYASNLDLPEPERFDETRFFREWAQPQGVAYAAGAVVLREEPWETQVYLQRSTVQGPFSRDALEQLDQLIPHWQRAVQMRQRLVRLRSGQDLLAASLDAVAMPTLMFDEIGQVAHANRSARALLHARESLWEADGRLAASTPELTRELHLHISNAVRPQARSNPARTSIVVMKRSARLPLTITVLPLRGAPDHPVRSGALMFVFDPEDTRSVTAPLVRRLFDLSTTEAELAVALCAGHSPEEIATDRGRALSTVRSQIRSLFAKTGTNRQADLISLLLASPACFVAKEHRESFA